MQTPTTALGRVSDMFKAAIPGSAELATPDLVALVFSYFYHSTHDSLDLNYTASQSSSFPFKVKSFYSLFMYLAPYDYFIVLWFTVSLFQRRNQVQMHHNFDKRVKNVYYYVSNSQPDILWQQL